MLSTYCVDNYSEINDFHRNTAMMSQGHWNVRTVRQRVRQRRRIGRCCPWVITILLLSIAMSGVATASRTSRWLQQRLRQLAAPHMEEFSPIDSSSSYYSSGNFGQDSESTSPLLVVTTHEGQVWALDSRDGSLVAGFSTGPPLLVIDDHNEEARDGESCPPTITEGLSQSRIVPSLDGMLYWRQPIVASTDDGNDNNDGTKLVPIASIRDLVDNPIQMCQDVDGENCDILTATSLGPSLFSLNCQGSLNWARARGSSTAAAVANPMPPHKSSNSEDNDSDSDSESDSSSANSHSKGHLLLQRQDYLVQQISTQTGEQVWNITWGSLEALDFLGQNSDATSGSRHTQSSHFLPSGNGSPSILPSIIFANEGKSVVAVWTQPPKFLWKRDFPSIITNVLGIEHEAWQTLNVVDSEEGLGDSVEQGRWSGRQTHPELPFGEEEQSQNHKKIADPWFWWWAGGAKGLGKKNKYLDLDQYYSKAQQHGGLIFMPRPGPEKLVRNSWSLSRLWNSPSYRGEQSFHRFIADYPRENTDAERAHALSQSTQKYPYPPSHDENFYDTSNMPRLVLIPPLEHANMELPAPPNIGGVFLSWSLVMAIITLLVGAAGAAYIIYGRKKQKWLAKGSEENSGAPGLMGTSMSVSGNVRGRSISAGSYQEPGSSPNPTSESRVPLRDSHESMASADLSSRFSNRLARTTLNRCSSAPLMPRDDEIILGNSASESIAAVNARSSAQSPNLRALSAIETKHMDEALAHRGQLVKHKSAPVDTPSMDTVAGVGMIDGIPLIRYSRYQSEFREIEPLGKGGFGTVFRCSNVLDGRQYAVKKVSIRSSQNFNSPGTETFSQELHRVLREVKFLALLDHPNIVRYYTAWLEMEEKDAVAAADDKANPKSLSRRYSSGLLTSLDATNAEVESQTNGDKASKSTISKSHLKMNNRKNPFGWNNDFIDLTEESASSYRPKITKPVIPPMEDCGFIFEEGSEDNEGEDSHCNGQLSHDQSQISSEVSKTEIPHSVSSSWEASYSTNMHNKRAGKNNTDASGNVDSKAMRHTLYIQMQLCSSKTLADFLADPEARRGPTATLRNSSGSVDIPYALRLFHQIVQAVHHVHQQGLIHRDLKPSNCFIDENGMVKVGDFGLSRESNDNRDNSESPSVILNEQDDKQSADDNTIGVGTRSYSSPEQMNGSDYDSKTDIYSLGVMLFELLYPMYTGMERTICLQKLRFNGVFPDAWELVVSVPFPTLDELVRSMLSHQPKDRPSAEKVARNIQSLLDEYSITLQDNRHDNENDNIIFLRVEAKPAPDVLKHTIQLIQDAAAPKSVEIMQYGMRSSNKNASATQMRSILEFAVASAEVEADALSALGSSLALKLEEHGEILVARHVWHRQATQPY